MLARVPHREKEVEVIAEEVRDFLNEQAEQLEDTLQIPKLYLLHSDPDLELHERLMMADGGSPAPSYLREDYLRLFRCIVPENIDYYLSTLAQQTAYLTLIGMGRSLQVELPIDEAYVPLRTTMARWRGEDGPDHLRQDAAGLEEDVELSEVFRQAARSGRRGVVLLGEPGSGKTTGARQLAWRLASRHTPPQDLGLPAGVTPVLLRFRNLRPSLLAQPNGLRAFLEAEVGYREGPGGGCEAGPDLWNRRGLLWILDGLDEVVEPGARRTVSRWVQQTLEDRPDDWFLVTCRFQGYYREGVPLGPKFAEFHVRPLDDGQVQRFVRDWFAAAYGKLLGPGPRAATRAQADSDELLEILARPAYQTGHLRELCTNPLLLTILCIVFHEERKLPTGRAELYAHCVRVLLEYWRRDLYRSELGTELQPYDAEAAQAVLARVGWWMHQEQYRTAAPLDELAAEASRGLAEVAASSGLGRDGPAFLERMRDEAGILAMAGEGRCGFLHLSFQEYLAAEHAAREGLARPVATRAPESWWREVALLSLRRSRPFCEMFFRELLQAGIAEQHPDLAQRCLEETLYFTPSPFLEVLQRRRPQETDAARPHDARIAATLRLLRERAAVGSGAKPQRIRKSGAKIGRMRHLASFSSVSSYNGSKAGVVQMARMLAAEWGRFNINVNCISPSYALTPMHASTPVVVRQRIRELTPLGHVQRPEDLYGAAIFLASAASNYVTGHDLMVDGGHTLNAWLTPLSRSVPPRVGPEEETVQLKHDLETLGLPYDAGGIRDLETSVQMVRLGVTRFGVGLAAAAKIPDECAAQGGIEV